jgi:hypothetical protein
MCCDDLKQHWSSFDSRHTFGTTGWPFCSFGGAIIDYQMITMSSSDLAKISQPTSKHENVRSVQQCNATIYDYQWDATVPFTYKWYIEEQLM